MKTKRTCGLRSALLTRFIEPYNAKHCSQSSELSDNNITLWTRDLYRVIVASLTCFRLSVVVDWRTKEGEQEKKRGRIKARNGLPRFFLSLALFRSLGFHNYREPGTGLVGSGCVLVDCHAGKSRANSLIVSIPAVQNDLNPLHRHLGNVKRLLFFFLNNHTQRA